MAFKSTTGVALALALLASSLATSANAGSCWNETGWYVPYNCDQVGTTNSGKMILICCN